MEKSTGKVETHEPQPQAKEPSFSPGAIDQIMANISSTSEGAKEFRRRGCTFTIFPEQCVPGTLPEAVRVGITELDSDEELRAYKAAGGIAVDLDDEGETDAEISVSQQALAVSFGRLCVRLINGRRLTSDERRVFWEVLDGNGRLTVGMMYLSHCTGGDMAVFQKRSLQSVEVW